uniref:AAA ATPase AAA+ lid domain-containing protein n=1 Tax=Quercus lobata TaxID=97700 RepID=A0A7N2QZM6_QUELO
MMDCLFCVLILAANPPVRANVLYLSTEYSMRILEAVKHIFKPYFDKASWFQNSSMYHFSMFHASHHITPVPATEDEMLICDLVASLTLGFVGADLANIVNEAALLAARRGSETVTREDIMEAVERAKFGINDKQLRPSTVGKELGKLFPWMPALVGRNDTRQNGLQGPLRYQTLS